MATLITGGTGFIGSRLAKLLIQSGERPVIFDIAPVRGPLLEMDGSFDFALGSLADRPALTNCRTFS